MLKAIFFSQSLNFLFILLQMLAKFLEKKDVISHINSLNPIIKFLWSIHCLRILKNVQQSYPLFAIAQSKPDFSKMYWEWMFYENSFLKKAPTLPLYKARAREGYMSGAHHPPHSHKIALNNFISTIPLGFTTGLWFKNQWQRKAFTFLVKLSSRRALAMTVLSATTALTANVLRALSMRRVFHLW